MSRFERHPALVADAGPVERLEHAQGEIARLRARVSTLEQLATETAIRVEGGTMLAAERGRTRQLEEQLAAQEDPLESAIRGLETAWAQIHRLRAELERASRPWWRRRRST